jgi:MFS family permease
VLTGLVFGRVAARLGVRRVMVAAVALAPVALGLYAASPNAAVAFVPIVLCGSLYFFALSSFNNIANLRAPSELRGRVLSLNQVVLGGVYAVALNVEGQLGDVFGLRVVTIGGAVISLLIMGAIRVVRPGYTAVLDEPVSPPDDAGVAESVLDG